MRVRKSEPAAGDAAERVDPPEADSHDEGTQVDAADGEAAADSEATADGTGAAEGAAQNAAGNADTVDDSADVEDSDDADDAADAGGIEDAWDHDEGADGEGGTPAEQESSAADAKRRPRGAHARRVTPRQRLRALVAPRANKTQALIALACLVLGFGLSVQVQSTSSASSFSSLRQSELVSLLDRLTNRQDHLRREVSRLQQEKAALSSENGDAARQAAQDRQDTLGILAGTEPAAGPGIELTITDPHAAINAADLLNAVEELRDSGAEVMQIGSVRIGADTYFLDTRGGVIVDGHTLTPPYRVLAIGDPHTMGTAMNIPGGVLESLHRSGAEGTVTESRSLSVTAVREP